MTGYYISDTRKILRLIKNQVSVVDVKSTSSRCTPITDNTICHDYILSR